MGYRYLDKTTAVVTYVSAPDVSPKGGLYFNTTNNIFYSSDGTEWVPLIAIPPTSTGGVIVFDTVQENGVFTHDLAVNFDDADGAANLLIYTLSSGTMPPGYSLPAEGSTIMAGTNTGVDANTTFSWVVKGTDGDGGFATQGYQQQINTVAPTVTGGTVTIGSVSETVAASYDVNTDFTFGTNAAFSAFSLVSGTLPSGLSLNTSTGVISGNMGTVASNTTYTFTIKGTDTDGDTVDQGYSWTINTVAPDAAGGTVTIPTQMGTIPLTYDTNTNFTFNAGATASSFVVVSGALPGGLSIGSSTGIITGVATDSTVVYTFTVRVTDTDGDTADQAYSWSITTAPFLSSGGQVSTFGSYTTHIMNSSATFYTNKLIGSAEYLIVGGGGGGTNGGYGGGGGGGGHRTGTMSFSVGSYPAIVGGGGSYGNTGGNGGLSSLNGIQSLGGGNGGNDSDTPPSGNGVNGGSGGGAGAATGSNMSYGGSGTYGQGNDGADKVAYNSWVPSGGGGAGGNGTMAYNHTGPAHGWTSGAGGSGTYNSITGSNILRAGGGGASSPWGGEGGSGTGNGANLGGGGQGGSSGGSGVIVIKYATPS